MSYHIYGRSLKLAVSKQSSRSQQLQCTSRHLHTSYTLAKSNTSRKINRNERSSDNGGRVPNPNEERDTVLERQIPISQEDLDFIHFAKAGNFKANVRRRIYSSNSILKPSVYDIFSSFSRQHTRQSPTEEVDIPPPPNSSHQYVSSWTSPKDGKVVIPAKRDPSRTENHRKLFETIDIGVVKGPVDWPATFYLVACANPEGVLDTRIRAATISYLVKQFVKNGRVNEIFRLYVEIQNSWLALHERESDAIAYLTSLISILTYDKKPETGVVNQLLETFQLACDKFDKRFMLGNNPGIKEILTPSLLVFLAKSTPLRKSLETFPALFKNITSPDSANDVIVQLYKHLNQNLLATFNLKEKILAGSELIAFYTSQSKILQLLALLPRTTELGTKLAQEVVKQAVTWEEVLEAKKLVMGTNPNDIVMLQSTFMASLHRISQNIRSGSIRSRQLVEFLTDILSLTNFRGSREGKAACIGACAAIYARMGAFSAMERLLDSAEAITKQKPLYLSLVYLRDAIFSLREATRAKALFRRDAKQRAADIALRLFQLHTRSVRSDSKPGPYIDQTLVRDIVPLLQFCGNLAGIQKVCEITIESTPKEKLRRSTVVTIVEALTSMGDVFSATKVLRDVQASRKGAICASTLNPFLTPAIRKGWTIGEQPLDQISRMGIEHNVIWSSVAHLHGARNVTASKTGSSIPVYVKAWANAMQKCADEVVEGRKGLIMENTIKNLEHVFSK